MVNGEELHLFDYNHNIYNFLHAVRPLGMAMVQIFDDTRAIYAFVLQQSASHRKRASMHDGDFGKYEPTPREF